MDDLETRRKIEAIIHLTEHDPKADANRQTGAKLNNRLADAIVDALKRVDPSAYVNSDARQLMTIDGRFDMRKVANLVLESLDQIAASRKRIKTISNDPE